MAPRPKWTEQQRTEALRLYGEHGAAEAARRTGIPAGTVASWASRAHLAGPRDENLQRAAEVNLNRAAELRAQLAIRCYTDALKLLDRLWQPRELIRVVTLRQGEETVAEAVRVLIDEPLPGDQRHLGVLAAILMDKGQLLSGEATARFGKAELDLERELEAFAMGAVAGQQPKVLEGLAEPAGD